MSQSPNKKVYFGKTFHFPDVLPNSRVVRSVVVEDGVIAHTSGIGSRFIPSPSSILGSL